MERVLTPELAPLIASDTARELSDFNALVRTYQPRVFRFVLASLRDTHAAENLTQECFVKAYQARSRFRGDSAVGTWLMQIAVNLVRDHMTSMRLKFWRRATRSGIDPAALADWLADQQSSPETLASAKQQLQAVWEAAAALSEKQRTVFLLRFVEDMDLLEIAAVTGMKEGTVKTHLFRALETVRERIGGSK